MLEQTETLTSTEAIHEWRSIVTLVVFVLTNVNVLFPFHIPIFLPRAVVERIHNALVALRIIPAPFEEVENQETQKLYTRLNFPMNLVTAPIIADLFLLAISAIGRDEVYGGTIGANNIEPIDIMIFFITLAYIAISIDASGLIRYLAFRVLQSGGEAGHRLFLLLYAFFFGLGSFIGNDPIILSGTAFLAYMTRVSSNIVHPRAWIHTQFAIANIASAILVSSNPTNLVLAGAFKIKFITYTANMIVPVVVTAILLFPFLLYVIFANDELVPRSITMHELSDEAKARRPVNPNIPYSAKYVGQIKDGMDESERVKARFLEEIMNPFLDKSSATFGAILMAVTLVTVLTFNAVSSKIGTHPVFWITLPAAVIMFSWDIASGWRHRKQTREVARKGRGSIENGQLMQTDTSNNGDATESIEMRQNLVDDAHTPKTTPAALGSQTSQIASNTAQSDNQPRSFVCLVKLFTFRCQETFPTATAVLRHLPFALVPFAFAMFVLVQALVTKGWVPVFAYGWHHWVNKTGTVGAVGGMGFLSVVLCNFAGTNIGTAILLSRVIQSWQAIHDASGVPITDRTFWATVYSMAIGLNYGAFSTAFSASLAGLLWRDILSRKHIHVRSRDFARINLPIIAISMAIGCATLIGEVYIVRKDSPYKG